MASSERVSDGRSIQPLLRRPLRVDVRAASNHASGIWDAVTPHHTYYHTVLRGPMSSASRSRGITAYAVMVDCATVFLAATWLGRVSPQEHAQRQVAKERANQSHHTTITSQHQQSITPSQQSCNDRSTHTTDNATTPTHTRVQWEQWSALTERSSPHTTHHHADGRNLCLPRQTATSHSRNKPAATRRSKSER
jgi:hypothetical protein